MARKTERAVIGGTPYIITQLGARAGRLLYKKLVTAIGPVLREAFLSSLTTTPETATVTAAALTIRGLEAVPEHLFEELCEVFASTTLVQIGALEMELSKGDIFDQHFAGEYSNMLAWIVKCIEVNGFLGKLGSSPPPEPTAPPPSP